MAKNFAAKTVAKYGMSQAQVEAVAYEVWKAPGWTWCVVKKNQGDDTKPYASWFCVVYSPMTPEGEWGDTYVSHVTGWPGAVKVKDRMPEVTAAAAAKAAAA